MPERINDQVTREDDGSYTVSTVASNGFAGGSEVKLFLSAEEAEDLAFALAPLL